MTASTTALRRVFVDQGRELDDPDPTMSPEEVLAMYQDVLPHLVTATIAPPEVEGDRYVYRFEPAPARTKG